MYSAVNVKMNSKKLIGFPTHMLIAVFYVHVIVAVSQKTQNITSYFILLIFDFLFIFFL